MRRRDFIAALYGTALAALPIARTRAQDRVRRIGMLTGFGERDPEGQRRVGAFQDALQKLGWVDGRNVRVDTRWAPDAEARQRFARELVALQPDVIVTDTTPPTRAVQQETRVIPIVFTGVTDPVGSGFVTSLPRPGGHLTGFTNLEPTMAGKWLELLKEIAPHITRVAILFNPATAAYAEYFLGPFKAAGSSLVVEIVVAPVRDQAVLESAINAQTEAPNGGLVVMPDIFTAAHRGQIISLAARHRLPSIYPFRYFAEQGGLLSYGNDPLDMLGRTATYVDRILKAQSQASFRFRHRSSSSW